MPARTILVVEDDPDVRDSLADALETHGYRVLTAGNGLEAIRLLRDEGKRPDLILLDMLMPVMGGWAFRSEQQKLPDVAAIPVVVMTAYGLPHATVATLSPAALLKKPMDLRNLLDTVDRLTENCAPPVSD
jgi:CheY-like chemotaxis protein